MKRSSIILLHNKDDVFYGYENKKISYKMYSGNTSGAGFFYLFFYGTITLLFTLALIGY